MGTAVVQGFVLHPKQHRSSPASPFPPHTAAPREPGGAAAAFGSKEHAAPTSGRARISGGPAPTGRPMFLASPGRTVPAAPRLSAGARWAEPEPGGRRVARARQWLGRRRQQVERAPRCAALARKPPPQPRGPPGPAPLPWELGFPGGGPGPGAPRIAGSPGSRSGAQGGGDPAPPGYLKACSVGRSRCWPRAPKDPEGAPAPQRPEQRARPWILGTERPTRSSRSPRSLAALVSRARCWHQSAEFSTALFFDLETRPPTPLHAPLPVCAGGLAPGSPEPPGALAPVADRRTSRPACSSQPPRSPSAERFPCGAPAGYGLHVRRFLLHALPCAVRCTHLLRHLARE